MSCVQIRLKEKPSFVDDRHKDSDGFVYLDMPTDFKYRQTKRLTELTDAKKLKFDFIIDVDLDPTDRNYSILRNFANPNTLTESAPIPVQIISGSHVLEDVDIYVTRLRIDEITIKIRIGLDHWATKLKETQVCDVDINKFIFTRENIKQNIENNYRYNDGDPGFWFPTALYGNHRGELELDEGLFGALFDLLNPFDDIVLDFPREFLRPWFHTTSLLQKILCHVGWGFYSPFFESQFGRTLGHYMIRKSLGTNEITTIEVDGEEIEINKVRALDARATLLGDTIPFWSNRNAGPISFYDVNEDPGGHMSIPGFIGSYIIPQGTVGGIIDVSGNVSFKINDRDRIDDILNNERINSITIRLGYLEGTNPSNYSVRSIQEQQFIVGEDDNDDTVYSFDFDLENVSVLEGEIFGVWWDSPNYDPNSDGDRINAKGKFEVTGKRVFLDDVTEYDLRTFIDCELNAFEYLRELCTVFNLKCYTNPVTKQLGLFTPYRKDWFGEVIEGFWVETNIDDISGLLDPKSIDVIPDDFEQPRWRLLGFADHENEAIESLGLQEELWSRRVDLGANYKNEELDFRSELFEPVITNPLLHVPWFKKENEVVYDIGPNIVIFRGFGGQSINGTDRKIKLLGAKETRIAGASQYVRPNTLLGENGNTNPKRLVDSNIVYQVNSEVNESEPSVDLYDLVYKRWIFETLTNMRIEYLVDVNKYTFLNESFRNLKYFFHLGRPILTRLQEIKDYHHCKKGLTPMVFLPITQDQKELFADIIDQVPSNCQNSPIILWTRDSEGCYLLSIGGVNNGAIESVAFYYTTPTNSIPTLIDNTSPLTATLCDQTNPQVYAVVTYEDPCQKKATPTVFLDGCSGGGAVLNANYSYVLFEGEQLCPELEVSEGLTFTINSASYEEFHYTDLPSLGDYSSGTSQGLNTYDPTTTPCLDESLWRTGTPNHYSVRIIWEVQLFDECDPITLQADYFPLYGETRNTNCADTDAFLTYEEDTPGNYLLALEGNIAGTPEESTVKIEYRTSTDSGATFTDWLEWDKVTPIAATYIQARAIILWDNNICNNYFTDIITIDDSECTCLQLSTDASISISETDCVLSFNIDPGTLVCDIPSVVGVSWSTGVYQSGVVDTFVSNNATYTLTESQDVQVTIYFSNGCELQSAITDIPVSGTASNVAGK